jgi:hypothetical protein
MALVLADRVQETTTTTGTGTVTLAGAVSGYQSFAAVGDGNTTYYTITSGTAWEVGIGTYTAAGTLLARTTILSSSAGGAAITLAGTSNVFVTYPSARSVNSTGNSGGVPFYSAANVVSSSAALAANALVVGGGAGVAPATVTTGTGVVTALGVDTGTAGAFITFNGDLGTPSSGTVTNLTGTASININGTVGATTPDAASFTTLGWTGVKYSAAGSAQGPAITDYFTSTISLDASSIYEIDAVAYFLKTTPGTVIWTWTFSSAPDAISSFYTATPAVGFTTTVATNTAFVGGSAAIQTSTTLAHAASSSLTTAVYHQHRFRVLVRTNAATTIQLRSTPSAGTLTPQAGSYMRATKVL